MCRDPGFKVEARKKLAMHKTETAAYTTTHTEPILM